MFPGVQKAGPVVPQATGPATTSGKLIGEWMAHIDNTVRRAAYSHPQRPGRVRAVAVGLMQTTIGYACTKRAGHPVRAVIASAASATESLPVSMRRAPGTACSRASASAAALAAAWSR